MKKPRQSHVIGMGILLAGFGLSSLALAEAPGEKGIQGSQPKIPFEEMDKNKDGKLTPEEHRQFHEEKSQRWFQDVDQNKDGAVTEEEIKSFHERRHGPKKFEEVDTNKDGKISKEEFEAMHPQGGMIR